jgi:uncharacterized membrane protein
MTIMNRIGSHISRCLVAGIVALLPIAGLGLTLWYIESTIARSWLARQPWYVPGMGIVAALVIIYLIGLSVSSLIGRWAWRVLDAVLGRLPLLGRLYATLKQIVGYSEGENAIFKSVVLVKNPGEKSAELGLVTNTCLDDRGCPKVTVFIPFAANPTSGRLLLLDAADVVQLKMPVNEALKSLVSVGMIPPM